MSRIYSLRKSRQILHWSYSWFQGKAQKTLSKEKLELMESNLRNLEEAIFSKDRSAANELARKLDDFTRSHSKKTPLFYIVEIGVAIIFALLIATLIKQVWFEQYQIPTGSMRPSFREQDHLTVTKTAFGLNAPLQTQHYYFNPDLVQRGGVVIWSGDNIPLPDTDSTFLYLFPYKKRYIKRLIGKPGDILYFYGGKIYGIDKDGKPIEELLTDPWMQKLEHIPFINFEGKIKFQGQNQFVINHFHRPIGRIIRSRFGKDRGELFDGERWKKPTPFAKSTNAQDIQSLGDFWGIRNFATASLMTKEELQSLPHLNASKLGEGVLYLYLRHHPNLVYPSPSFYIQNGKIGLLLPTLETVLPLQQKHLDAIMNSLYTSRFVVKDERARQYSLDRTHFHSTNLQLTKIPDGTFEFFDGKAESIGFKGIPSQLPKNHPLYRYDFKQIQQLFNFGINFIEAPLSNRNDYSNRYAYFRDGDLYLMGAPILTKDDPTLIRFVENEVRKQKESMTPYLAFRDRGPPLKDGKFDQEWIKKFGLKVPDGHYLVLGDNHANSADSRVFGFVPQENIQGAPTFVFWPPGERWGWPPQSSYSFITLPRLIIWGIAGTILLGWYFLHRRKMARRLFKKN